VLLDKPFIGFAHSPDPFYQQVTLGIILLLAVEPMRGPAATIDRRCTLY
jgi:hypothetical protein